MQSSSERRLVENEVIFRSANEEAQQFVEKNNITYKTKVKKLHFLCECANFECREHIELAFDIYRKIHADSKQFIIKPGHEVINIERVVKRTPDFYIVRKNMDPEKLVASLS